MLHCCSGYPAAEGRRGSATPLRCENHKQATVGRVADSIQTQGACVGPHPGTVGLQGDPVDGDRSEGHRGGALARRPEGLRGEGCVPTTRSPRWSRSHLHCTVHPEGLASPTNPVEGDQAARFQEYCRRGDGVGATGAGGGVHTSAPRGRRFFKKMMQKPGRDAAMMPTRDRMFFHGAPNVKVILFWIVDAPGPQEKRLGPHCCLVGQNPTA